MNGGWLAVTPGICPVWAGDSTEEKGEEGREKGPEKREVTPLQQDSKDQGAPTGLGRLFCACGAGQDGIPSGFDCSYCFSRPFDSLEHAFAEIKKEREAKRNANDAQAENR